jgi:hypothetical protein
VENGRHDNCHDHPFATMNNENEKKSQDQQIERRSSAGETQMTAAKVENPLAGYSPEDLTRLAENFAKEHQLEHIRDDLRKGAFLAQNPTIWETMDIGLTEEERQALRDEVEHSMCFILPRIQRDVDHLRQNGSNQRCCTISSSSARLRRLSRVWMSLLSTGLKSSTHHSLVLVATASTMPSLLVVSPSVLVYQRVVIFTPMTVVNSAPYLCCAVIGCWLTDPLNRLFGRRGTIFITAFLSFITCIWQGVTDSWLHLWGARFVLGLGIGPKSATVPVYAAECAPAKIRGALVMQWQVWTAFGIMLGSVFDLGFFYVPDVNGIVGLRWRLMLGSAGLPALVLLLQVFFCPERFEISLSSHLLWSAS